MNPSNAILPATFARSATCAVILVSIATLGTLQSCNAIETPVHTNSIPVGATDWVIMDPPLRSPRVTFPDPTTGTDTTKAWSQLKNEEIVNLLSNTRSEISVGKYAADGTVTYLLARGTAEIGTYQVIMDYTPYIVEDAVDPTSKKKIGDARVGVGLRMTARVTTMKANIDLGSLLALGVAANVGSLRGTMTVDTIGIRVAGSGGTMLSSTTIDETSIQKTLEALAVIQSKLADSTTHLDPQVIWVKPTSDRVMPSDVARPLQ